MALNYWLTSLTQADHFSFCCLVIAKIGSGTTSLELLCQLSIALEWMLIGGDYWSGKLLKHINLQRVMTSATELLVSYPDHEQQTDNTQQNSMVLTTENTVTNQIQDNKNMSPVVTNFAQIDRTIPKMDMIFNLYYRQIIKMLHSNAINIQKSLVFSD